MSVILFSVLLGISGYFRGSSADKTLQIFTSLNITAKPGENVTLPCKTEKNDGLLLLEWSREDLGDEAVFLFRDGRPFPPAQHKSYRNRVFLNVSQMKDGDLSVVLKNVTMKDTGTYECRVVKRRTKRSNLQTPPISTVHLSVVPPGDPSPGDPSPGDPSPGDPSPGHEDGGSRGLLGLIALPVLAVLVLLLWIYKKKSRRFSGTSGLSDKKMDDL